MNPRPQPKNPSHPTQAPLRPRPPEGEEEDGGEEEGWNEIEGEEEEDEEGELG